MHAALAAAALFAALLHAQVAGFDASTDTDTDTIAIAIAG